MEDLQGENEPKKSITLRAQKSRQVITESLAYTNPVRCWTFVGRYSLSRCKLFLYARPGFIARALGVCDSF